MIQGKKIMRYIQILAILLLVACSNNKEERPIIQCVDIVEEATEQNIEDARVYHSKKKNVPDADQPPEKDIYIYFIEIKKPDIVMPEVKYKDVMGFTAPKDIYIPNMPDIGPK